MNQIMLFSLLLFVSVGDFHLERIDHGTVSPMTEMKRPDTLKYCLYNGIGVDGYDLLTFYDKSPRKGEAVFSSVYDGGTYWFIDEVNRKKFESNPVQYLPMYGGWCATNVASKQLTKPRLDLYIVNDDGLFLFERTLGVNGKRLWLNNKTEYKRIADQNYSYLVKNGRFPD